MGAVAFGRQSTMLILALDTSTRAGSVALARDGVVVGAMAGDADRLHVQRLPGVLTELVALHGVSLDDVDRLAVLSGPGGFTGLRVGLATIQGLAFALGRTVVVASTLEVLARAAHEAHPGTAIAGAWMRGMRGEVFSALYRPAPGAGPSGLAPLLPPMVGRPDEAAHAWHEYLGTSAVTFAGDAWETPDGDALRTRYPAAQLMPVEAPPLAGVLARLAAHPLARAVAADAVAPTYVRRPDAVITRERSGVPLPEMP